MLQQHSSHFTEFRVKARRSAEASRFFGTTVPCSSSSTAPLHSQASTGSLQVSGEHVAFALRVPGRLVPPRPARWGAATQRGLLRPSVRPCADGPGAPPPPGEPHLRRRRSHTGSVFTRGGSHTEPTQSTREERRAPPQRILSSCRSIPAICRNLSFLRCLRAMSARAVSSGSWV